MYIHEKEYEIIVDNHKNEFAFYGKEKPYDLIRNSRKLIFILNMSFFINIIIFVKELTLFYIENLIKEAVKSKAKVR